MTANKRSAATMQDDAAPRKKIRHMSESQLNRKRESDRAAQRQSRARTRDHITHLENLVKSLRQGDDERVSSLLRQLDEKEAEIQRLRNILGSIGRMVEVSKPANSNKPRNNQDIPSMPSPVSQSSTEQPLPEISVISDIEDCSYPMQPDNIDLATSNDDGSEEETIPHAELDAPVAVRLTRSPFYSQSIPELGASIAGNKKINGRLWYLAGALLSKILTEPSAVPVTTTYDEDIAIRAVFHGWGAAAKRYELDNGWLWLRELDERIYIRAPKSSRLMHLRNCRLIFLKQSNPHADWDATIPPFFRPRPSQELMSHDPMIEHFPWPAFRERLLFAPLRYATDQFMDSLRTNLDFNWNLSADELYVQDKVSGLYSYSSALNERLMDIRCYNMRQEFFDKFPELRADMPGTIVSPYCSASIDLSYALREYICANDGQVDLEKDSS